MIELAKDIAAGAAVMAVIVAIGIGITLLLKWLDLFIPHTPPVAIVALVCLGVGFCALLGKVVR